MLILRGYLYETPSVDKVATKVVKICKICKKNRDKAIFLFKERPKGAIG